MKKWHHNAILLEEALTIMSVKFDLISNFNRNCDSSGLIYKYITARNQVIFFSSDNILFGSENYVIHMKEFLF